jgi:hypothetical protein
MKELDKAEKVWKSTRRNQRNRSWGWREVTRSSERGPTRFRQLTAEEQMVEINSRVIKIKLNDICGILKAVHCALIEREGGKGKIRPAMVGTTHLANWSVSRRKRWYASWAWERRKK